MNKTAIIFSAVLLGLLALYGVNSLHMAKNDPLIQRDALGYKQPAAQNDSMPIEKSVVPAENVPPSDFSGDWDWADPPPDRAFFLRIQQDGSQIQGSYCATAFEGHRVDCGFEEGLCRLQGRVTGTDALVTFKSCYGSREGKAQLRRFDNRLEWTITEVPEGQWHFAPRKAVLEMPREIRHQI